MKYKKNNYGVSFTFYVIVLNCCGCWRCFIKIDISAIKLIRKLPI